MRALVCLVLTSTCVAFGQGISTKNAYLPPVLVTQVKAELETEDDCPPLARSISTTWLRLHQDSALSVSVEGFERCSVGENNKLILLYSQTNHGWHKVLDTKGSRLRKLSGVHHGWHDLDVSGTSNLFISVHYTFRFDGREYKPADCVEVDNTVGGPPRPKTHQCSFDWKVLNDRSTTTFRVQTEPRE